MLRRLRCGIGTKRAKRGRWYELAVQAKGNLFQGANTDEHVSMDIKCRPVDPAGWIWEEGGLAGRIGRAEWAGNWGVMVQWCGG